MLSAVGSETDGQKLTMFRIREDGVREEYIYPCYDTAGVYWFNASQFAVRRFEPCFFCSKLTNRIDLDYGGPYCGEDDTEISDDLERLSTDAQ